MTLLVAIPFLQRLAQIKQRGFDQDEFEHLHAIWNVVQGLVPYRDFFEHHTPLFYYFLAPILALLPVDQSFEQAQKITLICRFVMWLLTLGAFAQIILIGKKWHSWAFGLAAIAVLELIPIFRDKTFEIRPDVLTINLWLASILFMITSLAENTAPSKRMGKALMSGLFFGLSLLCSQKMLFALPGVLLSWVAVLISQRKFSLSSLSHDRPLRAALLGWPLGVLAPISAMLLCFAYKGALMAFIECNLLLNLRWKAHFPATVWLKALVENNPANALLTVFALALLPLLIKRGRAVIPIVIQANFLGLLLGAFIMPVPQRQYILLFLPLMALMIVEPLFFIADLFKSKSARDLVIAISVSLLCLPHIIQLQSRFVSSNKSQMASMKYIAENSNASDTYMTGSSVYGFFRPNAYYHYFFHYEIRMMLDHTVTKTIVDQLKRGALAPTLLQLDGDLTALLGSDLPQILEHYRSANLNNIYIRVR